jgi:hypothetical protein
MKIPDPMTLPNTSNVRSQVLRVRRRVVIVGIGNRESWNQRRGLSHASRFTIHAVGSFGFTNILAIRQQMNPITRKLMIA